MRDRCPDCGKPQPEALDEELHNQDCPQHDDDTCVACDELDDDCDCREEE